MIKFTILSAFLITLNSCNSQSFKKTNDLKEANLKGQVKSTTTFQDIPEDEIVVGSKKEIKIYDIHGNLLEEKNESFITRKIESIDNETIEKYYLDNNKLSFTKKTIQKFDKNNRIIEEEIFSDSKLSDGYDKITYQYDTKNNLTKEESFDKSGKLNWSHEYSYNLANKLTKEIRVVNCEDCVKEIIIYDVNKNTSVSNMYHNNAPTIVFCTTITKYNSNNDVIEETKKMYYDPNVLGLEQTLYFNYRYDKFNNWITKTERFEGEVKNIIHREISYY